MPASPALTSAPANNDVMSIYDASAGKQSTIQAQYVREGLLQTANALSEFTAPQAAAARIALGVVAGSGYTGQPIDPFGTVDQTIVGNQSIIPGGLLWPDAGVMVSLDATSLLVISAYSGPPATESKEPSGFKMLGNDRIAVVGSDPFIIDSGCVNLPANSLLALIPDDWPMTGRVSLQQGNMTVGANECAVFVTMLEVIPNGLAWVNGTNGNSCINVL